MPQPNYLWGWNLADLHERPIFTSSKHFIKTEEGRDQGPHLNLGHVTGITVLSIRCWFVTVNLTSVIISKKNLRGWGWPNNILTEEFYFSPHTILLSPTSLCHSLSKHRFCIFHNRASVTDDLLHHLILGWSSCSSWCILSGQELTD